MLQTALVAGATGLIGRELLALLLADARYDKVVSVARRPSGLSHPRLEERIADFDRLAEGTGGLPAVRHAYCCLGTTMKKAGSREAFYRVDFEYVAAFGKLAKTLGCASLSAVSAMGADARSGIFYNEVKGKAEEALAGLGIPCVHLLRPSLLLGDRQESRPGERIGQLFASTFNFLIPNNYKGIEGSQVAHYMHRTAWENESPGVHIHLSGQMLRG